MGNEARRQELEKPEEVEEEEETTLLLVRKSRTGKSIIPGTSDEVISEGEGQAIQSTPSANGAHKEESTLVNDVKKEKPDGALGNDVENLVFFDKVEGIWKCRICSWTYQNGSVCIDHIQNHNGQFHMPMHCKFLNFETEGVGHEKMETLSQSFKASEEIESAAIDLIDEETGYDVETVLQKQNTHDLYCPNCNSCITRRVILRKRKRTKIRRKLEAKRDKTENPPVDDQVHPHHNKIRKKLEAKRNKGKTADADGDDDGVHPHHHTGAKEEVDTESGPDLFRCLSCFSFFIPTGNGFRLFRIFGDKSRKENVQNEQVPRRKKNWFTSIFASDNQDIVIEQGTDVPRASEPLLGTLENDGTVECEDEILLSPKHEHSTTGLVAIYGSGNEQQKITEKIDAETEQNEVVAGYHLKEPLISNDQFAVVSGYHLKEPIRNKEQLEAFAGYHLKEPIRNKEHVEVYAGYHLKEPIRSKEHVEVIAGYHLKEPIRSKEHVEVFAGYHLKEPIRSKEHVELFSGYHLKEPIRGNEKVEVTTDYHLKEPVLDKDDQVTHGSDLQVTTLIDISEISNEDPAQDENAVSRKGGSNLVIFSNDGSRTNEKSEEGQILIQTGQKGSTGNDTVITIESHPASEIDIVIPAETVIPTQITTRIGIPVQEQTEDVTRNSKVEVIKSIVYGGLAESITSLSVVSSAAGGDAATLNILALGMANLIGGFFVICHNLWELRCEQPEQATNLKDRYQELLGRRQNFKLHAIVCILSYLVFGLMPIVVYGFSFRQSEERELKLLVVGAASLLCIIGLSIGKAYVCRPPKAYVKTVANFVILGFMASGISYAAGVLVKRFLEQLGLFQSTSSGMIFNGVTSEDSTWASY